LKQLKNYKNLDLHQFLS